MSTPTFPPCLPPLFGFVLHPRNVYICVKERDDIGSIGREAVDRETAHIRCFRIRSRLWFFEFFQTCGVKSPKLVPPTSILLLLLFLHLSLSASLPLRVALTTLKGAATFVCLPSLVVSRSEEKSPPKIFHLSSSSFFRHPGDSAFASQKYILDMS